MTTPLLLIEQPQSSTPLEASMLSTLFETTANTAGLPKLDGLDLTARRYQPRWYSDVDVVELAAKEWSPQIARLYYMHHSGRFYWLNGTSPPIHEVNAVSDIVLTAATVLEYLAFFCFFVRGEEGPFLLVDRIDHGFLPKTVRGAELRGAFRPTTLWGQDENGDWRASSLVYYGDALFYADFVVSLSGMIEMKTDWPILRGTGQKVDAPLNITGIRSA